MLHFDRGEYAARIAKTQAAMAERGLDALLLFAPESHYWLTGYDTFGFCFFQCLVLPAAGAPVLLTRSADLRQAQLTSIIEDIRIWRDRQGASPADDLAALLDDLGLGRARLGWETATHGLTHANGRAVAAVLGERLMDVSGLVDRLRLVKSPAEIAFIRKAGAIGDRAFERAMVEIGPGAEEGPILAALQGEVFAQGGDYPGNEFIIGSGDHALLCRYHSGRRVLEADDQLTLEWAGVWRRYHAALMRTVVIGTPRPEHLAMHAAARAALLACEAALRPGNAAGDVFAAHAEALDAAGFASARLNACGYAMGARFTPSWMDPPMFYEGNSEVLAPGMAFFLHMILMDSETGCAMCLGRSSLVTEDAAEPLSRLSLDLPRA